MSTQLLTYLFVGASFALYIGIAIWSRAGSTKDFYVAGGGVHPVANGMASGRAPLSLHVDRRIRFCLCCVFLPSTVPFCLILCCTCIMACCAELAGLHRP